MTPVNRENTLNFSGSEDGMILVVDAGNTNITLGVFEGKKLRGTYRMTTKVSRTSVVRHFHNRIVGEEWAGAKAD